MNLEFQSDDVSLIVESLIAATFFLSDFLGSRISALAAGPSSSIDSSD